MERQPWHERRAGTEHIRWFQSLVELHELTRAWIESVRMERPEYELTRGLSKEATENLWMLESLTNTQLSDFLDDTLPEDLLGRLDHAVWAAQAITLRGLSPEAGALEPTLLSVLEQASFRHGRKIAELKWRANRGLGELTLPRALLALSDSPLSGLPRTHGFLTRRALPHELDLLWRSCPHRSRYPEIEGVADVLCDLHTHVLRGYLYVLNHHALLQKSRLPSGECGLRCTHIQS